MAVGVINCLVLIASFTFGQVAGVEIGTLPNLQHGVSGVLHFLDSRTLQITNFNYDGLGPGAFLYYYRPGQAVVHHGGVIIPLPSQVGTGQEGRFQSRRFTNEDFTVTMPTGTDVCDIGTLTIWCRPFTAFFTRIEINRDLFVNEGSDPCTLLDDGPTIVTPENFNCMPLHETLQLSWRVDNENSQVDFRLCGCLKPGTNQYMGFGLSGSPTQTSMFEADPTITWVDTSTGEPNAVDYYLSGYTQCRAGEGACPDTMIRDGGCSNDVTDVSGFVTSGQQCVSFSRPFITSDSTCDTPINITNQNQYIVWGIGGLGETAFKHFTRAQADDAPINLGRSPTVDECHAAGVALSCKECDPFPEQCFIAREDTVFRAQIGPSGDQRGYLGITDRVGWGIAWYINGTLIPELVVERGKTYTFLVEGGDTPDNLEVYHPFYITDSIAGGRLQNAPENRNQETIYAGFENEVETAVGPLCQLMETEQSANIRQQCNDYQTYIASLEPTGSCNSPQAGKLVWTPDENTPDTVYYQCATHLNLGWKITVVDENSPDPQCGSGAVGVFSKSLLLIAILCVAAMFTN